MSRVLSFPATPIAEDRVRVLEGVGGPLGPVWLVGLSRSGHPVVRLEVPLIHIEEGAAFVRAYLARRDRAGQR